MDYMVYAYLQLGQDQKAQGVAAEMKAVSGINPDRFVSPYALAVSPARYALERGDWKSAAELEVRPSKFAYADAMTHFARALGAARLGNPTAAKADVANATTDIEKRAAQTKLDQANASLQSTQLANTQAGRHAFAGTIPQFRVSLAGFHTRAGSCHRPEGRHRTLPSTATGDDERGQFL